MNLQFVVRHQIISRVDTEKVVRDSQNYLKAVFSFSEDWHGTKTAVFKSKAGAYNVLLDEDNACLIPWEVLEDEAFFVSVFCGDLITANVVKVPALPSGYEIGEESRTPTEDIFNQIIDKVNAIDERVDDLGIDLTATVDNTTGTPEVVVTKSGTDQNPTFNLAFSGIKGAEGEAGQDGAPGATPEITATASVSDTTGTPSVNVTQSGTVEAPFIDFAFSGLKGATGAAGADGSDGVSPEVTIATITGGHSVTITDETHPSGQTFDVLDGNDAELPWITPQDFGAVADGVTDDTSAVNQAITSAMQGGGVVFFPAGEYLVDWSGLYITVTSDLVLRGEGMNSSVIHLATEYTAEDRNGIVLSNHNDLLAPSVTIKNIGFIYDDNDSSLTLPDDERLLVMFEGVFGDLTFDSAYFHIGGSATTIPPLDCLWLKGGADNFVVRNCLFENFSNREIGGCLWLTPIEGLGTNRTINHVRVLDSEFRNTNRDEAIGIWQRNDDVNFYCRDVVIDGNSIVHKNWNGECFPSNNVLSCFTKAGNVYDVHYIITNNSFEIHSMNNQPIKFSGLNGVVFADNEITVVDRTSGGTNVFLGIEGGGKATVRSNTWTYNSAVYACEFKVVNNDVDFYDNVINSVCSVYFGNNTWTGSDAHTFNVVGNIIHIADPAYQLVIRKNATYGNMIFANNIINRGFAITGTPVGNGLEFRNNKFNNGGTRSTTDVKGSYFTFEYNSGVLLSVDDTKITSKMTSFNYIGKADDLQFKEGGSVVDDSTSVRDDFFTSCDIVYFGTSTI